MILTFSELGAFEDWRYNLLLVAPGKGEAKKTVSQGFIRLEHYPKFGKYSSVEGCATDDILSISNSLTLFSEDNVKREVLWIKPEIFKGLLPIEDCRGNFTVEIENDPAFDARFDEMFWDEHVIDSIVGLGKRTAEMSFILNPDRFGKLGLIRPRGLPFSFDHVEWADRSILRWQQSGTNNCGVYTYGK